MKQGLYYQGKIFLYYVKQNRYVPPAGICDTALWEKWCRICKRLEELARMPVQKAVENVNNYL